MRKEFKYQFFNGNIYKISFIVGKGGFVDSEIVFNGIVLGKALGTRFNFDNERNTIGVNDQLI
jgi:hypothetical protein